MIGHRQLDFNDYLDILRRRWWVILLPTIVVGLGVYLFSLTLPDRFMSKTLVLVEGQKVPEGYVKSVVSDDIGEQLGTMQQQIMSRTRLQPIVEKFGLYKSGNGNLSMEDRIDMLRQAISVSTVKSLISNGKDEVPGFTISFTGDDPRLAQQVCSEITSMFIEENLKLREQISVGTTDFLKLQLNQAKQALDDQDSKLADFQRKYMGSLPGNEQTDMNMMMSLSSQLDAITSQINRAQQEKAYQESLLSQQVAAWENTQKTGGVRTDTLENQLAGLQSQLVAMRAQYTDNYPDVIKLKQDIEALKAKIADNAATDTTPKKPVETAKRLEPAPIQQLRFQLHQDDMFIQEKTHEQSRIRQQLGLFQQRVSMSPDVAEQYKKLTRDHQTALEFYNSLLAKENESEMATSLEQRQQGEQLRVMDPPDLPEKPSFPNRPLFAGGGLGVGFALGVGISLLLELLDKSMRTENDVEQLLGLPTLAMVPTIDPRRKIKGQAA
jgi:protein tyrosine kinase modulator